MVEGMRSIHEPSSVVDMTLWIQEKERADSGLRIARGNQLGHRFRGPMQDSCGTPGLTSGEVPVRAAKYAGRIVP